VAPVTTSEGIPAVLKVSSAGSGSEHEHLVLRRWGGAGAVRLLRADPHQRAVLLERLHRVHLSTLPDARACEVVADLYSRLHVPALPQLGSLAGQLEQWTAELRQLPRNAPIPHRLVEQAVTSARDLTGDATAAEVVLHGDLHYDNVLAADREPWLAISPDPRNGDPHFELAPMLWHRWDDLSGHIRDGVRRRFYTLVDAAGLDEDRARAWTLLRVVHAASRDLDGGQDLTRFVAIAKAIQD
jgi:streptomycin 6-kinase